MSVSTAVVTLCNRALDRVGSDHISSLTEDSEAARLVNQNWPDVRDTVLNEHEWAFATVIQSLAVSSDTNDTPYTYRYQLPVDPHPLYYITLVDTNGYEEPDYEYRIMGDALYTDLQYAQMKYVSRSTDPTNYPHLVKEAMIYLLASRIAWRLTQRPDLEQSLEQKYTGYLLEAIAKDAQSSRNYEEASASWVDYERGGQSYTFGESEARRWVE